jgi:hypothetical protein
MSALSSTAALGVIAWLIRNRTIASE